MHEGALQYSHSCHRSQRGGDLVTSPRARSCPQPWAPPAARQCGERLPRGPRGLRGLRRRWRAADAGGCAPALAPPRSARVSRPWHPVGGPAAMAWVNNNKKNARCSPQRRGASARGPRRGSRACCVGLIPPEKSPRMRCSVCDHARAPVPRAPPCRARPAECNVAGGCAAGGCQNSWALGG